MKKIQLIFTVAAIFIASAGVFATQMRSLVITYHIDSDEGTSTQCDQQVTPTCSEGVAVQCQSYSGGSAPVFVRNSDNNSCVALMRPNP